jgi:hypothetical protein
LAGEGACHTLLMRTARAATPQEKVDGPAGHEPQYSLDCCCVHRFFSSVS